MRTVETQTDIQLGTEMWRLRQGFSGKECTNNDRDIHAWDIVQSSHEDDDDEDNNESCSDDGYNEFEDCGCDFEDIDGPKSTVTDKSEDDNVLELDVMEFDESDVDWEAVFDDDGHADSKEPDQYHYRKDKLAEDDIDDSENSTSPLPGVKFSDTRKGRATRKRRARATKQRFNTTTNCCHDGCEHEAPLESSADTPLTADEPGGAAEHHEQSRAPARGEIQQLRRPRNTPCG